MFSFVSPPQREPPSIGNGNGSSVGAGVDARAGVSSKSAADELARLTDALREDNLRLRRENAALHEAAARARAERDDATQRCALLETRGAELERELRERGERLRVAEDEVRALARRMEGGEGEEETGERKSGFW